MRGLEPDRRHDTGFERFLPRLDAHAPAVTRLQSGEAEFRVRCDEVIADGGLMTQELVCDKNADDVTAEIVESAVAFAVAIEAGQGIGAAGL